MTDIPSTARVVIIGGGVVGVSGLYHLAKAGWHDCVLLEKNELTSGSTWHAAGNVPTFSVAWSLMNMQRYSVELYKKLAEETGCPIAYHITGSLRLAHTRERMQEFAHVKSMARRQGMAFEMLGVNELRAFYPFLQTRDLEGALYDPDDGDIDPAQLTQALAKGARDRGAKIIRFCPVFRVLRHKGEWVISTPKGDIRCDIVVNASGYRAREVGQLFGREVPMAVIGHQYLIFDEITELADWSHHQGRKLPLLRDVDSSWYLRQEKNGMNLGPYERDPRVHWHQPEDPMPDDFSFQLYPDDLERLEWHLEDAVARVPLLGTAGLSKVINGPIPYTPDGNPLIGPMPGVPNAFEACVFTFGIAQGGGAGKVLAEWIVESRPQWDMWSCDPRRFTGYTDQRYCVNKAREVYAHEYAIHFPFHDWPAGRGRRLSPLHDFLRAQGAQFAPFNGWERASWYARAGDDVFHVNPSNTFCRDGVRHKRVREECLHVRDSVGILDLPGFSRFIVKGQGARDWLDALTVSHLPVPGRLGLAYFADEQGRLITEMSIMTLQEEHFILISAAAAQWHDREWLEKHLPRDNGISLEDVSEQYHCQILTGPKSRDVLAAVCDADLAKAWLGHQETIIAGLRCRLVRVSFAGELGWEIHTFIEDSHAVFDALWQAGQAFDLRLIGMLALDSLRLEKGYRRWKVDLLTDYTLLQAGLERFIDWNKPDFLGSEALRAEKENKPDRRFVSMIVKCDNYDAPSMATIWHGENSVGEVTSGGYGHRVDASLALGAVRADLDQPGQLLEIGIYGKKYPAVVQADASFWDPGNERLQA